MTSSTTACFVPSLDYVVAETPRWDLRELATVYPAVGPCMKSVGEVMAIGQTFGNNQKALRRVDDSCTGSILATQLSLPRPRRFQMKRATESESEPFAWCAIWA